MKLPFGRFVKDENLRLLKSESRVRMAGSIAHLFNNSLTVVTGNLELAAEEIKDHAAIGEYIRSGKADRFILCGSVKPTLDDAVDFVKKYHAQGLKGIKMHPNYARFYPNDKAAWPAYEICDKLDLPVLLHSGRTGYKEKRTFGIKLYTEDYADLKNYEAPIAAFPNVRFVLCHAGALQNEEAVKLAKQYKNVWLDIHGQGVDRIRAMVRELGPERLMYGSDWAFYPVAVILARTLVATENDPTVRRMLFSENARRFWKIA